MTKPEVIKKIKELSSENVKRDVILYNISEFLKKEFKVEHKTIYAVVDKYLNFPIIIWAASKYKLKLADISIQMKTVHKDNNYFYEDLTTDLKINYDVKISNIQILVTKCLNVINNFNNTLRPNESPRKYDGLYLVTLNEKQQIIKLTI